MWFMPSGDGLYSAEFSEIVYPVNSMFRNLLASRKVTCNLSALALCRNCLSMHLEVDEKDNKANQLKTIWPTAN